MATTVGAPRHRARAQFGFRRKDRLVGRRFVGRTRGERLSKWQDRSTAKLIRYRIAAGLSFLLIHGLSESVRGLGIADRGKPGTRQVLRRLQPDGHPARGWRAFV